MSTATENIVNQILTFTVNEETYGIQVQNVREVLSYQKIIPIPKTPDYMKGIINLRNSVVPVIDLRTKLGFQETEITEQTSIVVLDILINDEALVIGALVDAVKEVLDMPSEDIEPPPQIGMNINTNFITGLGKIDEQFVIIISLKQAFSSDEMDVIAELEKRNSEETEDIAL